MVQIAGVEVIRSEMAGSQHLIDFRSQLLSQPPIPLNQAKPGLKFSSPIEAVIMKGLSKDPKQRYGSVVEFANALKEVLATAGNGATDGGIFSKVKSIFRK